MTIIKLTRSFYGLIGVLYVLGGIGSMLIPTGWLPAGVGEQFHVVEPLSEYMAHLLQEFGTLLLAVGFTFIYLAVRKSWSAWLHWSMTAYFTTDCLIHWIGPEGPIGSLNRGLINSVPPLVMLALGLLNHRVREGRIDA